jgi:site-specific DNA-methyltransferase (adenine-specific)
MNVKTTFSLQVRNPDVLTCISNLSSDEVPTPPEIANKMLDQLERAWQLNNGGKSIWTDKSVRILDPFSKSGVFLREATLRFISGLEKEIPDLQERVDHILKKQIYGIGITSLTALMSRRTLYCSKSANGENSITKAFDKPSGNVWFEVQEHEWLETPKLKSSGESKPPSEVPEARRRCKYCGATSAVFDRDKTLDTHAYAFIHTDDPQAKLTEIFGETLHFDVVIGNPPYQMTDAAGGGVDSSIYHLFVNMAKKLEPRYLSMVIPSRWMGGATRGVGDFNGFREKMMTDGNLRFLVDYPNSKEVFPGVDIKGGVCYFLWDRAYEGEAEVTSVREGVENTSIRKLNEFDVFVRDNLALQVLKKVKRFGEKSITTILTADTPFGIPSNFENFKDVAESDDVALYYSKGGRRAIGYLPRNQITKNTHLIDNWKLLTPGAGSDGGQKIPDMVLGKPWIAEPGSVCSQTFLAFFLESEEQARNLQTYFSTKFFRFLVSLRKITQNGFRSTYEFVPAQDLSRTWSDEDLYSKYSLTQEEIDLIESSIKSMPQDENPR